MFFPYSTDAPLYHLPFATGGIIAANIVIYFATTFQVTIGNMEPESIEWLMLQFDQVNPMQWITSGFMHLGFGHLLGNMLFLFCFGLVVEGKVGSPVFLAIYFISLLMIGAVAQIPMFLMGGEGAAAGASGVISTLMVIALIWAPENEISFFYWFMFVFVGTFDARILMVAGFFVGLDVLTVVLTGFAMSGAMGHMIGALMGLPIGLWFLHADKVDCEGWDLISRNTWLQQYPLLYGEKQKKRDQDKRDEVENPVATALALTGGDVSKSQTLGVVSTPKKSGSAKETSSIDPNVETSNTSQAVASGPRVKRRKKRRVATESPEKITEKCRQHPEFNRLAFVLRQSLQAQNLPAAQQAFLRLDALKIGRGLNESTLMQYTNGVVSQQRYVDAIRPLAILIENRGPMSDDACLRLAQIQMRVLKRADQAILTLEKITDEGPADAAKRARLQKRDQLLAAAKAAC